ncbi:MAG: metallophosphoesterase family protein, partial [bacterium]
MGTRFIHAADLHLGVPLTRFDQDCAERGRGARIQALENLLGQATANSADFVVIAGDLFDDNAIDSTTSRRAFHILENASVPVYVLPGNHDPLLAGSVWEREPWSQETTKRVKVLRERQPLEVKPGVILFPCPVFRKTSMEDPTGWIPPRSTP